jgi:hypothetical protein
MRFSQDPFRGFSLFRGRASATDEKVMTERERAEEQVRAIVEELDRATLALLYKTLHDALGFRIETADIAIGKLGR